MVEPSKFIFSWGLVPVIIIAMKGIWVVTSPIIRPSQGQKSRLYISISDTYIYKYTHPCRYCRGHYPGSKHDHSPGKADLAVALITLRISLHRSGQGK